MVLFLGATTDAAAAAALPAAGEVPEASAGAAGAAHGVGWWAAAGGDSVAAVALVARWSRVEEGLRRAEGKAEGATRRRAAPLPAGLMVRDVYALSPWELRRKAQVRAPPSPFTP